MDPCGVLHATSDATPIVAVHFLAAFSHLMIFTRDGTVSFIKFLPRLKQHSQKIWDSPVACVASHETLDKAIVADEFGHFFAVSKEATVVSKVYHHHAHRISSLTLSPDLSAFLTASDDGFLKLFDLHNYHFLKSYYGHQGWITGVAFTPDGERFATACTDKKIRVFGVQSGTLISIVATFPIVASSLLIYPNGNFLIGFLDGSLINFIKPEEVQTLRPHQGSIPCLALHPSSKYLLAGASDFLISIYNFQRFEAYTTCRVHRAVLRCVNWSSDGVHFVTADAAGEIIVWEFPEANLVPLEEIHIGRRSGSRKPQISSGASVTAPVTSEDLDEPPVPVVILEETPSGSDPNENRDSDVELPTVVITPEGVDEVEATEPAVPAVILEETPSGGDANENPDSGAALPSGSVAPEGADEVEATEPSRSSASENGPGESVGVAIEEEEEEEEEQEQLGGGIPPDAVAPIGENIFPIDMGDQEEESEEDDYDEEESENAVPVRERVASSTAPNESSGDEIDD